MPRPLNYLALKWDILNLFVLLVAPARPLTLNVKHHHSQNWSVCQAAAIHLENFIFTGMVYLELSNFF